MNKKSIDIFKDARCNDGEPIYEAFDDKEEYERAYEIYEAWLIAEMKRWDEFRKLFRTNPEAARAASEVAPEFAPEPHSS
ncbi:MAG: hypothetical protein LBF75_06560 [Treponema sp.]|jgi:hypothetical protein|nr:hypothetical protein [Treponema sp.]